ncbi:MAG: Phage Tail Collar [Parcubacteria group bacterium]|nr:Phage Tail Collar [Parcubacteria group bacterium]
MDEETIDTDTLSLDEKMAILMDELPGPIQDFLSSPERDATSLRLTQKYGLHADQAGAFERGYIYMLLGIYNPDEFVQALREAGIAADTVRSLTNDVNEQVFKKLREEELNPESFPKPAYRSEPAKVEVPVMQVGAPQEQTPPVAAPIQPAVSTPPPFNLIQPQQAAVPAPFTEVTPAMPPVRTMASDINLIQHSELAPALPGQGTVQAEPHPWQTSPAQSFQTASVPYTSMPPASRAIPAPPVVQLPNEWRPQPTPVPSTVVPQKIEHAPQSQPLTKEYGSDPYRESI